MASTNNNSKTPKKFSKKIRFWVSLDHSLGAEVMKFSKENYITDSQVINMAVVMFLKKNGKNI